VHVFVRRDQKLEDLAGKRVINTKGLAAAYTGPIMFERLASRSMRNVPHPIALAEMLKDDKYAAIVFVSSKLDAFLKPKWRKGSSFCQCL
jgi:hypothetical protein